MFKQLQDKIDFAKLESEVLEYWKSNNTFAKSISNRDDKPGFTFYEGPPTANGKPGIHHVLSRTIKDLICRYKTLRGYQVFRKAGWDTQGLPVEIEVEKALGIKSKDDIEKLGVEKFNQACKDSVFKYLKEWHTLTERMGYWLNLDDAYITYKNEYIESVWWSLQKFFDGGKIYRGYKIQPYCPRCETPLSTHEVAQGYEDVKDPSVYVVFKIKPGQGLDGFSFLVWTTTPWTLISNVALAVGPEITYVKIKFKDTGENIILAKDRLSVITQDYEILGEVKGSDFENIEYEQLLNYVTPDKKAFYVGLGDFVTTEDGSGIVHIAPAFGEDDYQLSRKYNLPVLQPVDKSGKFVDAVTDFKGRFVKETDDDIILKLKAEGKLYRKEKFVHSYPHCWRCHTPLLYYARESWYINTSSYKDKMIELNNKINWYPPETGSGRFGNWLEENRDWALSRDRYWGTPLPIWGCACEECKGTYTAIGSIAELKERALNFEEVYPDEALLDLHKPYIDRIILKCEKCGCDMHRVEEVIDAWYDSGSMPFAQHHYPFENKELFERNYPADFIAEGVDQTRGWFYSLHAIGSFVFGERAFKNLIVNDMVLDKTGLKMSKHKGNIVNPFEMFDKYGADTLRWYLVSSSPVWRPKTFNEDELFEVRNKFFDTLINTYRFFVLYSNLLGISRDEIVNANVPFAEKPEIDRWILSAMNSLKKKYFELMDNYDITRAARLVSDFTINDLSNWYIRRNRKRFRNPADSADKLASYSTLFEVLTELLKLISPVAPFLSEHLFRNLTGEESVHLSHLGYDFEELSLDTGDFEIVEESDGLIEEEDELSHEIDDEHTHKKYFIDSNLLFETYIVKTVVELARSIRADNKIKTRQPLSKILISPNISLNIDFNNMVLNSISKNRSLILDEINVNELEFMSNESEIFSLEAKPVFEKLGPKHGKRLKNVMKLISELSFAQIRDIEIKGTIELKMDNELITIEKDEIWIKRKSAGDWITKFSQLSNNAGITISLDINLDEQLVDEGFAREYVKSLQELRKRESYDISEVVTAWKIDETSPRSEIFKNDKYKKILTDGTTASNVFVVSKLENPIELKINNEIAYIEPVREFPSVKKSGSTAEIRITKDQLEENASKKEDSK